MQMRACITPQTYKKRQPLEGSGYYVRWDSTQDKTTSRGRFLLNGLDGFRAFVTSLPDPCVCVYVCVYVCVCTCVCVYVCVCLPRSGGPSFLCMFTTSLRPVTDLYYITVQREGVSL